VTAVVFVVNDDGEEVASSASSTTTPRESTTSSAPETTQAPPPTPGPGVTGTIITLPTTTTTTTTLPHVAVSGTVIRTCGAHPTATTRCFLAIRSAPRSDSAKLGEWFEDDVVTIECAVTGERVHATDGDLYTSVWARDPEGHYLSMAFLDVPGWDTFSVSVPC
jgi:hypothetical protein